MKHLIGPVGLLPVLHALFLVFCSGTSSAQPYLAFLESAPGDCIGQGRAYFTTNQAAISFSGTATEVNVYAFGFRLVWTAASGLAQGDYTDPVWISGYGRSCHATDTGTFRIHEFQTNVQGQVERFWSTFVYQAHPGDPPLTGEVRYNSMVAPPPPTPRDLRVPGEFGTIQAAVDSANPLALDIIRVEPGLYVEAVQCGNKRLRLVSAQGPVGTLISPPPGKPAISLSGTPPDTVICGFTLTNGTAGVVVRGGASPTIISNVIVNCGTGLDCGLDTVLPLGSPVLTSNRVAGCAGNAIWLAFAESPLVEGNLLEENARGIGMNQAGAPQIRNNVVRRNRGAGIGMGNRCDADVIQNIITDNAAEGIGSLVPAGTRGPVIVNNTIARNGGPGISIDGYYDSSLILNNIVVGNPALYTGNFSGGSALTARFNDFFSPSGTPCSGVVTNLEGIAGNISVDPFFACEPEGDLRLLASSPCIDAGTNDMATLPATDRGGQPRIMVGHTNGVAKVDLGVYEFDPLAPPPVPCLFLICPSSQVVVAPVGQTTAVVYYPLPFTTPGASLSCSPPSGSTFPGGTNTVSCTSVIGTNIMECSFEILVLTATDFDQALNDTMTWSTSGDRPWFVQTTVVREGSSAAQSGAISDAQQSTLQTTLTGPGTLRFWWKSASETGGDFLSCQVNGLTQTRISGLTDWSSETVYVGQGVQTVRWVYSKNPLDYWWQDAGWLDQVSFTPGLTAPTIAAQPSSVRIAPGMSAAFSVTALGTPPFQYQWQFDGHDVSGAVGPTVTISNATPADAGRYRVIVSNAAGFTNSTEAVLTLVPVLGWGADSFGQTITPADLSNVVQIAGGWHHSVALRNDGSVVVWGDTRHGQAPIPQDLTNAVAIASRSGDHILALRNSGTVAAWGDNTYHQTEVPQGLVDVVAVAAGGYFSIALKKNGTAVAWGDNTYNQTSLLSTQSNLVAVAAGDVHSLALRSDGTVLGFGDSMPGRPAPPSGLTKVTAIAAGGAHSLALLADGTVVCWGNSIYGQTNVPSGLSNVVAISAGDYHSLALKTDGSVVAWGQFRVGESFLPAVAPVGLTNVISIAAGSDHDLALIGAGHPIAYPAIEEVWWMRGSLALSLETECGRVYRLLRKAALSVGSWAETPLVPGTGQRLTLTDETPAGAQSFYRVQRW